jgi:hypothetical protein
MPIAVTCTCGKSMRAKDELAGKRVRCPGCGAAVTIPAVASAPAAAAAGGAAKVAAPKVAAAPKAAVPPKVGAPKQAAAAARPAPAPRRPVAAPADDGYDFADDAPPAPPARKPARPAPLEPVGLAAAAVPMPPIAAPPPPAAAAPAVPPPFYGIPTSRRTPQEARRGTGLFHLSGMTMFFLVAVIVIPSVIFLIKIGPVTATKEWDRAYNAGMEDTSSVIAKAMEAHKSANGIFARKSREMPKVHTFTWVDEPVIMWRMPDWVEFHGRTTEGRYTGRYYTRTGEVQAVVECDYDELNVTGRVKNSVVECEIDGKTAEVLKPSPEQQRILDELDALD